MFLVHENSCEKLFKKQNFLKNNESISFNYMLSTNPTSKRPTKRNCSSNNDSLQKHKSESMFTRWRHGIL